MSAHKLKMTTVFVIHGISGSSQENWFPWLKERLESFGVKVIVLNFPDADNPKLGEWLDYFKQYASELDEEPAQADLFQGDVQSDAMDKKMVAKFVGGAMAPVMQDVYDHASVAALTMTFDNTSDAPVCDTCGSIMVRNAACYKCLNCGATSGCS